MDRFLSLISLACWVLGVIITLTLAMPSLMLLGALSIPSPLVFLKDYVACVAVAGGNMSGILVLHFLAQCERDGERRQRLYRLILRVCGVAISIAFALAVTLDPAIFPLEYGFEKALYLTLVFGLSLAGAVFWGLVFGRMGDVLVRLVRNEVGAYRACRQCPPARRR